MSTLYRWFCANGKAMSEILGTTPPASRVAQDYPA
jgi:hypothetical protein